MSKIVKNKFYVISLLLLLVSSGIMAQVFDILVDQNAPGAYRSIGSALARLTPSSERRLVYISNGTYNEKIDITAAAKNISLIGESVDGVIITNGDYNGDGIHGSADSYTVWADADNLYCENLTIVNSAGNVGQAAAIRTDGDKMVFKNCRFRGFQDTYYAHSNRQYHLDCYIEGATDFIYGDATAVYENCTINCVQGGQYITAPADSKLTSVRADESKMIHGILFNNCNISADNGVPDNSYYLGRPWQPNSSSVYMNCTLGDHIRNIGWSTWENDNHLSSYFAEYKNVNSQNELLDISQRATWSFQLSDSYASDYYNLAYFLEKEGIPWDPVPFTVALDAPTNVQGEQHTISWNPVASAVGYVIIRNDSTIGFSENPEFLDEDPLSGAENIYKIKSVNINGNLSPESDIFVSALDHRIAENNLIITICGNIVKVSEPCSINIFGVSGKMVYSVENSDQVETGGFTDGIYLIQAKNNIGKTATKKVFFRSESQNSPYLK